MGKLTNLLNQPPYVSDDPYTYTYVPPTSPHPIHSYYTSSHTLVPVFPQSQYIYIHDAINDYINCKSTTIAAHELRPRIEETREIGNLTGSNGFITQFAVSRH